MCVCVCVQYTWISTNSEQYSSVDVGLVGVVQNKNDPGDSRKNDLTTSAGVLNGWRCLLRRGQRDV